VKTAETPSIVTVPKRRVPSTPSTSGATASRVTA
jgi:hypothetical protein